MVATLFLGKALLLGGVGALMGFAVGNQLAQAVGPEIFQITAKAIQTEWSYLFGPWSGHHCSRPWLPSSQP